MQGLSLEEAIVNQPQASGVEDCKNGASCDWKPHCRYGHPEGYNDPVDLALMVQDHSRRMNELIKDSKDPSKRPSMPPNFKTRPICEIKLSGSHCTTYSVADAEVRMTKDYPYWDKNLIVCPPGILYNEEKAIKVYDRAKELVVKNNRELSSNWRDKDEKNSYKRDLAQWEKHL